MNKTKVIFGLTCQSCVYPDLSPSATTTLTYLKSLGRPEQAPYILSKARLNIANLMTLLRKTSDNGIQAFRLSDSFIPMADLGLYDIEKELGKSLEEAGKVANQLDMYLSIHPSQFFLLTSNNPKVIQSSILNFNTFAKILSLMKLKNKPVLLTHVGAIKCWKNMEEACEVFCQNYSKMSPEAQLYMAVENDQTSHSVDSCMYIHKKLGIPVVFDHAHYAYKPIRGVSQREAIRMAMSTWKDQTPKVHLCSQAPGVKIHNHADYISLKDYESLLQDLQAVGVEQVIMMAEVKKKDEAILRLMDEIKKSKTLSA